MGTPSYQRNRAETEQDQVRRRRHAQSHSKCRSPAGYLHRTCNYSINVCYLLVVELVFLYMLTWCRVPKSWSTLVASYYLSIALWTIRLLFTALIGVQCLPLFRKEDPCEDIPLTPAQRQLLGLPPMTRPMTPQELDQTVTPPRFSRSNTPRSASSTQVNVSGSPLSERSALLDSASRSPANGSPYSPQLRSGGERRRLSYTSNRSSPLSISEFDAAGSVSTPTKGTRASVGLNNKWLYEKGRASPRLSGSVFS